jgi:hypothetical protein
MKLIDIINEEVNDYPESKKVRMTRNVFRAFKKGTVQIPHPRNSSFITFKYELNDNVEYGWEDIDDKKHYTITTSKTPGEGVIIYTDDEYLEDRCNNHLTIERNPYGVHVRRMVIDRITDKFQKFGVKIDIKDNGMKFVLDKPEEPLNETPNTDKTDKMDKKVKSIYNAFKKGQTSAVYHWNKFKYILPDDYTYVYYSGSNKALITPSSDMELYYLKDGEEIPMVRWKYKNLHKEIVSKINEKMYQFGAAIRLKDND